MRSPRDGDYVRSDAPTPDLVSENESVSGLQKKLKEIWTGWT